MNDEKEETLSIYTYHTYRTKIRTYNVKNNQTVEDFKNMKKYFN
jgi:hypothetical protein